MMRPRLLCMLFLYSLFIGALSCKRMIETPSTGNQLTINSVFSSDGGAQAAMTGVYSQMMYIMGDLMNGGISLDAGLSADELECNLPLPYPLGEIAFEENLLTADNLSCTRLFTSAYNLLYDVNSVLAGLASSGSVSAAVKTELQGEARFDRALLYFYLVNLYGGVPLALTTDYTVNAVLPRVSADSIYAQIVSDLQSAEQTLPDGYPGETSERTRPDKAAATALLARVWLFEGKWIAAEQAASQVISDPHYRLADLDSVFLANSPEAIWQLQPVVKNMATADGYVFLWQLAKNRPSYLLTSSLLTSMNSGDLRLQHWTRACQYMGQTYVYPYKYKQERDTGVVPEYEMVLRLAEQYLIRAEARVRQGNVGGALADLNVIRQRAGLGAIVATDAGSVLTAIFHERRVELFTEWGHRWLDLKRTGAADVILGGKPGWQPTDTLYPIPLSELQADTNVQQNAGY